MPRYAAFLRGVMPTNAKMPELKRAFEKAGFGEVKTLLGSGNLVFTSRSGSPLSLEEKAEAAMEKTLGRSFLTMVRPVEALERLLSSDPWRAHRLPAGVKRTVTFLKEKPAGRIHLPPARDGAWILALVPGEAGPAALGAHVPRNPKGPIFMTLLEEAFGKAQTTRTWETVGKVAR